MKIDVAVLSYRKPESLIYTLMTLKKHSGRIIENVYIQDDCSRNGTIEYYTKPAVTEYFKPWKIFVRENDSPARWHRVHVRGYTPAYYHSFDMLLRKFKKKLRKVKEEPIVWHAAEDVRYQWAINSTDKKYLLIIHDDIEFYADIASLYLKNIDDQTAIVGDLGQCWRCKFEKNCSPVKIMQKNYPKDKNIFRRWPFNCKRICRINEWSCLINVDIAKKIEQRERIFFGNYDNGGDVGAYWFLKAVENGYKFTDPLPQVASRLEYYQHCWQGMAGHSVWVDQGAGKNSYNIELIKKQMRDQFSCEL